MATAYELLGVPRDASSDELRRAYHRLAREQHPDRAAGSSSRAASVDFVALQEAWEAVRDSEARRLYDASLRADEAAAARVRARAAQVDLGEMEYAEGSDGQGVWSYACRCGAAFELTEQMLCAGIETLECSCCSLAIRPLYARVAEDEERHARDVDALRGKNRDEI